MEEKTTKTKQVKEFLLQGNVITGTIAVDVFHLYRLSSVIHNLRKRGMDIETKMMVGRDCNGNRSEYAQYRYLGDKK